MPTLPMLVACFLAPLAVWLLWQRRTRWSGLLISSALTAWAALICWAGSVLTLDDPTASAATARGWGIAGGALSLLTLALLVAGIWGAISAWRHHQTS